jgi:curved DNA-binding protein CbpA
LQGYYKVLKKAIKEYYEILDLSKDATSEQIGKSFKAAYEK